MVAVFYEIIKNALQSLSTFSCKATIQHVCVCVCVHGKLTVIDPDVGTPGRTVRTLFSIPIKGVKEAGETAACAKDFY